MNNKPFKISVVNADTQNFGEALGLTKDRERELLAAANERTTDDGDLLDDIQIMADVCDNANEYAWLMVQYAGSVAERKHKENVMAAMRAALIGQQYGEQFTEQTKQAE